MARKGEPAKQSKSKSPTKYVAELNLLDFLYDKTKFDFEKLILAIETMVAGTTTTIGYKNLKTLLQKCNLPQDSANARLVENGITNLIEATAYRCSAEIAGEKRNPKRNKSNTKKQVKALREAMESCLETTDEVVDLRLSINIDEIFFAANREWDYCLLLGEQSGWYHQKISLNNLDEPDVPFCEACYVTMCPAGRYFICELCGSMKTKV